MKGSFSFLHLKLLDLCNLGLGLTFMKPFQPLALGRLPSQSLLQPFPFAFLAAPLLAASSWQSFPLSTVILWYFFRYSISTVKISINSILRRWKFRPRRGSYDRRSWKRNSTILRIDKKESIDCFRIRVKFSSYNGTVPTFILLRHTFYLFRRLLSSFCLL